MKRFMILIISALITFTIFGQELHEGQWQCSDEEYALGIVIPNEPNGELLLLAFDYSKGDEIFFYFEVDEDGVATKYGTGKIEMNQKGKWNTKISVEVSHNTSFIGWVLIDFIIIDDETMFISNRKNKKYLSYKYELIEDDVKASLE